MEEKEMKEFSWTGMFLVTGFCFFLFRLILKILDGTEPRIFLMIGSVSLFLGLLNAAAARSMSRTHDKSNRNLTS